MSDSHRRSRHRPPTCPILDCSPPSGGWPESRDRAGGPTRPAQKILEDYGRYSTHNLPRSRATDACNGAKAAKRQAPSRKQRAAGSGAAGSGAAGSGAAGSGGQAHHGIRAPPHPADRHNRHPAPHRGDFERPAPRKSPQSPPAPTTWRLQAPCAPQIATITAQPHNVATSSTLRPADRHNHRPAPHRGDFKHPAPRRSPQSPPSPTSWRLQAPCAPQIATITAQPHNVASFDALDDRPLCGSGWSRLPEAASQALRSTS